MTVHHVATIVLMYFSWVLNFVRVGALVLVVHDAADSWLSVRYCLFVVCFPVEVKDPWQRLH